MWCRVGRYNGTEASGSSETSLSFDQILHPRTHKSAHQFVAKTLKTSQHLEDVGAYEDIILKQIIKR